MNQSLKDKSGKKIKPFKKLKKETNNMLMRLFGDISDTDEEQVVDNINEKKNGSKYSKRKI